MKGTKIIQGDCLESLKTLPSESIDCIITSPPYYGLRDYGVKGQIGLEKSLNEYLDKMLVITAECKRVLKKTGTMWWNHGDSYGGSNGTGADQTNPGKQIAVRSKPTNTRNKNAGGVKILSTPNKSLMLQAHRLVIRMIDEQGWILRNQIIWHKPNVMPSSVIDRFTVDFEPVFFFSKSKKYYFERQFEKAQTPGSVHVGKVGDKGSQIKETVNATYFDRNYTTPESRNKRTVWKIATQPYAEAHFATFPEDLITTPIKAGCPEMICKKCGKAREAIFEQEVTATVDYKKVGYTDCKCNAGWERGIVLDPFAGSGTTLEVARYLNRDYIGIELNPEYVKLIKKRLAQQTL